MVILIKNLCPLHSIIAQFCMVVLIYKKYYQTKQISLGQYDGKIFINRSFRKKNFATWHDFSTACQLVWSLYDQPQQLAWFLIDKCKNVSCNLVYKFHKNRTNTMDMFFKRRDSGSADSFYQFDHSLHWIEPYFSLNESTLKYCKKLCSF